MKKATTTRIFEPCDAHKPGVDAGHGYPIDCADCWANAPAESKDRWPVTLIDPEKED